MATMSDMILMSGGMSPWAGLQRGLSSGLGTASTLQSLYGNALAQRYQRQKMKQAQAEAPLQQALLQSKLSMAQLAQKYPGIDSKSPIVQAMAYEQYMRDHQQQQAQSSLQTQAAPQAAPQGVGAPSGSMANAIAAQPSPQGGMGYGSPHLQNQVSQAITPDFMAGQLPQRDTSPLLNRQISQAITPNFASSGMPSHALLSPLQQQVSQAMGAPFFLTSQQQGQLPAQAQPRGVLPHQALPQATAQVPQARALSAAMSRPSALAQRQQIAPPSILQQAQQTSPFNQSAQRGSSQSPADMIHQSIQAQLGEKSARANYYKQLVGGGGYLRSPPDDQHMMVAYAMGMGVAPDDAVKYFLKGGTLEGMAKEKHVRLKDVSPINAPTPKALAQIQTRKIAIDALDAVQPYITSGLAPYSGPKYKGKSIKQIYEQIKGENPDRQARFLAASALGPEASAARNAAFAGTVSIRAIEHISNKTYGEFDAFRQFVTPEVFAKSQEYLTKWVDESFGAISKNLAPLSQWDDQRGGTQIQQMQAPQMQAQGQTGGAMTIPQFNSENEQEDWFKKLTSAQQAQVIKQLGG
jgi:hypothetical protein